MTVRFLGALLFVAALPAVATELPSATSAGACTKNVSFAIAEGGLPVPAIPKFAVKWLSEKRAARFPEMCFSQIPSSLLSNYVIIFSSSETAFDGLSPSAHTYVSSKPAVSGGMINSSGGTWNYSYSGTMPAKVTSTIDLRQYDKPKSLFVRIYNQQGVSIGHYTLELLHPKERLLEQAIQDVNKEVTTTARQKPFAAPLSVYYVNCDVDGPPTEVAMNDSGNTPRPEPAPRTAPPVPQAAAKPAADSVLDFLSNPSGADIYVDGLYIGKTPFSLAVAVGEHAVLIRKQDFSSWQQRLQATPGKRRVFAFLEQKTLNLE